MLTIPTAELVGLLSDVIPFAHTDKDLPDVNSVLLEWDGDRLHAQATDQYSAGWCTWDPDDDQPGGDNDGPVQDDLFTEWGSDDLRWRVLITLADAAEAVKVFKLPAKEGRTPLHVAVEYNRLTIKRGKETGHSAITCAYQTRLHHAVPDLEAAFVVFHTRVEPTRAVLFDAQRLAAFAKVRPHAPLELLAAGAGGTAVVHIGSRFTGAIKALSDNRADDQTPAGATEDQGAGEPDATVPIDEQLAEPIGAAT